MRAKLVNNWAACAGALKYASDRLDAFGGEDSAMRVDIDGSVADGSGARQRITWDLLARRNHGPEIPATPAVILARKLAAGAIDQRGAVPCTGLFDLQDFAAAVAEFDIEWHATR